MQNKSNLAEMLPKIIEIARFAPSVHNTQPWRVSADADTIKVLLDPKHVLSDGDPTGRETIIGLGIFCEALRMAAGKFGLTVSSMNLQDGGARLLINSSSTVPSLKNSKAARSVSPPSPPPWERSQAPSKKSTSLS